MGSANSGSKSHYVITLSKIERNELESSQRSETIRASLAKRARIILLRAEGMSISAIARLLPMGRRHVEKWVRRFLESRINGLSDKKGRGRKPFFPSRGRRSSGEGRLRAA